MNQADVLEISRLTFFVILKAGGPIMAAGLAIGLLIAIFQTLTSIQEMTLTFVPKIIIIFGTDLESGGAPNKNLRKTLKIISKKIKTPIR